MISPITIASLSILSLGVAACAKPASFKASFSQPLIQTLHESVIQSLNHSAQIPGLKEDEFQIMKGEIVQTWEVLCEKGVIQVSDTDQKVRPCFVALQAVIEHVLSSHLLKDLYQLKGIIHTPMPATPLCTKGSITPHLVAEAIEQDPQRLFTVKARTSTVRDFLHQGGDLYVVYPEKGKSLRTAEQQAIYQQELDLYPSHLLDQPLHCDEIPESLIGATYLFQDKKGDTFVFAIQMTQAKDPKEIGNFGVWFGSLENPAIQERVKQVLDFIEKQGVCILEKEVGA